MKLKLILRRTIVLYIKEEKNVFLLDSNLFTQACGNKTRKRKGRLLIKRSSYMLNKNNATNQ